MNELEDELRKIKGESRHYDNQTHQNKDREDHLTRELKLLKEHSQKVQLQNRHLQAELDHFAETDKIVQANLDKKKQQIDNIK